MFAVSFYFSAPFSDVSLDWTLFQTKWLKGLWGLVAWKMNSGSRCSFLFRIYLKCVCVIFRIYSCRKVKLIEWRWNFWIICWRNHLFTTVNYCIAKDCWLPVLLQNQLHPQLEFKFLSKKMCVFFTSVHVQPCSLINLWGLL